MKQLCMIFILIWWSQGFVRTSNGNPYEFNSRSYQVQEREEISPQEVKNNFKKEAIKGGLPDALGTAVDVKPVKIDDRKPAGEVIKEVADAVVPLIAAGLALIPGGALIAGIMMAAYGVLSWFLGIGKDSHLIKMIDSIKDDIDNMKKKIADLEKKIPEMMRKEREEQLKSIISRAIDSELSRNKYICSKYVLISADYINDIRMNKTISESLRSEMVGHIHNCDNFLKDTAEAFVYPEFADILWVASAVTSLIRLTFLAEVSNYGYALKIDSAILRLFWKELKNDIRRHFEFAGKGVMQRLDSFNKSFNLNQTFTTFEYQGCRIQSQLLYCDREMYPYGVPQPFHIFNDDGVLTMADYNITTNEDRHHIQIYYNDMHLRKHNRPNALFNCIMGPDRVTRVPENALSFRVVYVINKSYQLRVLYFTHEGPLDERPTDKYLTVNKDGTNSLNVIIDQGKPNNNSYQRFVVKTGYHQMAVVIPFVHGLAFEFNANHWFIPSGVGVLGAYVIENVYAFNVLSDNETKGKVTITSKWPNSTLILGVEFIVMPAIK